MTKSQAIKVAKGVTKAAKGARADEAAKVTQAIVALLRWMPTNSVKSLPKVAAPLTLLATHMSSHRKKRARLAR